ncbi:helix-turn-helix transcriptional regulator [Pseudomonas sp. 14P_8.1_Bac3]|uniref:helix-turn-helix domain-containing protein n=1 Tax=Pseudomonas sp. 14P_8.1_Bac3 TaxID=2971621 RepID=UPI0021C5B786|nr:helix-turn-helix transcriptional regulator [Pseudomonas sp. 14P_8.1_Bac3]MCU1762825.1 helix-turn-helix transcriptional regulator [Pseudomonas sp. 14P_8.1_Bac3]
MRIRAQTDQTIAKDIGRRIQAIRLKKNISLEDMAKSAGISRQTLHLLLNHGKGTFANLIAILRSINELERLSSLVEEVLPSPLQVIRMEGKKRQRASGRRASTDELSTETKRVSDW